VGWSGVKGERYLARVRIVGLDRVGLLRDITTIVADEKVNMGDIQTVSNKGGGTQQILATLEVTSVDQLMRLMSRIESISGVYEVRRDVPGEKNPRPN
jgi:GTP pyrophosphokinase